MGEIAGNPLRASVPIQNPPVAVHNEDAFLHLVEQQPIQISIPQSLFDNLFRSCNRSRHHIPTFCLSTRSRCLETGELPVRSWQLRLLPLMELPALAVLLMVAAFPPSGTAQWITSQHDNARTGAVLNETILTPANVNASSFGKIFSYRVDGDVYAQPLFLPHIALPDKSVHDMVFVATEHDSVYAFDATGSPATPLWRVSLIGSGAVPVPARDADCSLITPEIGITSTPVIDPRTGTLFVLARTKENRSSQKGTRYVQRLHALAITTGREKFGGPVEINAAVKGRGAANSGGIVVFDPLHQQPRAALLLAAGNVYL